MTTLLYKSNLVKVSSKGSKICPRLLRMVPFYAYSLFIVVTKTGSRRMAVVLNFAIVNNSEGNSATIKLRDINSNQTSTVGKKFFVNRLLTLTHLILQPSLHMCFVYFLLKILFCKIYSQNFKMIEKRSIE